MCFDINKTSEIKCKNEDLQELDCIQEKAIKEVFKYYDSYYELSIEEVLDGKKVEKMPTKNEFESLIGFMKMRSRKVVRTLLRSILKI